MHAIVIENGELIAAERELPHLPDEGILVRVAASAINRADLLQRRGLYPAPPGAPADIPGLEYAGTIERVGSDVTRWREGDRVMGIIGGGGYAEYVSVHEGEAIPVPESLPLEHAAAIPEAFLTAHDALFTQAHLAAGDTVLIHAAASGVGTAAAQLVRAAGARAIGTVRTPAKAAALDELGCEHVITADENWPERVHELTDRHGADIILDLVGGHYLPGNIRVLAHRGRLLLVGLVAGRDAPLDMGTVLRRRITITGTVMRARALDEKIATAQAFIRDALPLLESRAVRPVIDRVLPMLEAAEGHRLLERNETVGKVVLRW